MLAQPALPCPKIQNCGGNDNVKLHTPPQLEENFLPTQTQVLVHILPKIGNKVLNSPLVFRGCIYTASLCFCDASRREMAPDGNLEAKIICRSGLG